MPKRILAVFVSFLMVFTCISPISASASTISRKNLDEELFLEEESLIEETRAEDMQIARDAYNALSPEARAIFIESIAQDRDLLLFHKTYVDSSFDVTMAVQDTYSVQAVASTSAMSILSAKLAALSLPSAVVYSLKAMGASMVAAIADGPLPFGDILLAASTVGAAIVIAANWNSVVSKWQGIINAFKAAFADSVSTVVSAFNRIMGNISAELAVHPCVTVSDRTITINAVNYSCTTRAIDIAQEMQSKDHRYYPAVLYGGDVYVAQIEISRDAAKAILMLNQRTVGVMSPLSKYARSLCESLGGAIYHLPHGGDGYYAHYHAANYMNAHSWYFFER